ncbi:MAG: CPBP family intramembrane glutamic endopeptidase, partial [Acidimicrobiales bacterium]
PEGVGPALVRRLVVEPSPMSPAPPEAPGRERLPGGAPAGVGPLDAPYGAAPPPPAASLTSPAVPAEPARPAAKGDRRRLVIELVIVLAIFPFPYVVSAVQALVAYLLGEGPGKRLPILFAGHTGAGFPFILLDVLLPLAAAALVLYLLSLPGGDGGPAAIGLDRKQMRADLALLLPVFVLCDLIPIAGGGLLLTALGVHGPSPATGGLPAYYSVAYVAMAVVAGVVEELVVLGYLVRRLEQLGLRPLWVVVIAVTVRGSYHLYYGWGVLPILAWATVSVLVYRRFRRLAPFVVVHALWDTGLFLLGHFLLLEIIILTPLTIVFTSMWWHYLPPKAPPPSGGRTEPEAWSAH